MPDKTTWINSLRLLKVPEELSEQAADILSRQDARKLPFPLPDEEQQIVSRAWWLSQANKRKEA